MAGYQSEAQLEEGLVGRLIGLGYVPVTLPDMAAMRDNAPEHGLQTEVNGRTFQDLAKEVLKISDLGLKNRARFSVSGDTEQGFLKSLWDSADSGRTPADNIKDMMESDWQGDTANLFTELSY